ncbi:protein SRC2 homolog [Cotesia glomerata]|nr:protein SRC2 homolog [Cotesia glomerata]
MQYPGYGQTYPGYSPPAPYGGYPGYAPPQYPGGYNPYPGYPPYGPPQQPPRKYHGSKESDASEDWKKTDTDRQLDYGLFGLKIGDVNHQRHTTSEGTATYSTFKQSY